MKANGSEELSNPRSRSSTITGKASLRRISRLRFPLERLENDGGPIADLGRDSSLLILFGRGRRVRLADGSEWRIRSATKGRHILPLISSSAGTIASSGPLYARRSYGINLSDRSYTLMPASRAGLRRPNRWSLVRHDREVASLDDRKRTITTVEAVPTAAVLLALTLIRHGIPGEASLVPSRQ